MRIALLGGAFDPPHMGHLAMAKGVLQTELADRVWYVPTHTHIWHKKTAPFQDRFNMCWLNRPLVDLPEIDASPYEMMHQLNGTTLSLLNTLKKDPYFKYHQFSFIIGQDEAVRIDEWANHQQLIDENPFIVLPRDKVVMAEEVLGEAWYTKGHHTFLSLPIPGISSTDIRAALKEGLSVPPGCLHPAVLNYIRDHELYGCTSNR